MATICPTANAAVVNKYNDHVNFHPYQVVCRVFGQKLTKCDLLNELLILQSFRNADKISY